MPGINPNMRTRRGVSSGNAPLPGFNFCPTSRKCFVLLGLDFVGPRQITWCKRPGIDGLGNSPNARIADPTGHGSLPPHIGRVDRVDRVVDGQVSRLLDSTPN